MSEPMTLRVSMAAALLDARKRDLTLLETADAALSVVREALRKPSEALITALELIAAEVPDALDWRAGCARTGLSMAADLRAMFAVSPPGEGNQ